MNYFITGFLGTGKSAVAEALRSKGYMVYDVDQEKYLTHWVDKNTGEVVIGKYKGTSEFYDKHDFNWDRDTLQKLLDNTPAKPVFICGLTSNQTNDLDLFNKVFLLKADKGILRQRIIDRKAKDPTKIDQDVDYGFSWHQSFDEEMLKKGAIPIDASLPLQQIIQEIEKKLV